jgi:hypothetical protein
VRSLTVRSVVARGRARVEGLRLVLRISGDADVVRVRVHRMRGTAKGALVSQAFRSATSNPVRLRIADRALRRRLTPGRYRIEVAAGMSRDTLGAVASTTLRVR